MHPLHPVVVHFPIACWVLSTIASSLAAVLGRDASIAGVNLADHARVLLWIGVTVTPLAIVLGVVDYVRFRGQLPGSSNVALHAGWMGCAFALYLMSGLFREAGHFAVGLIVELTGFACLVVGGLAASRIVYPDACRSRPLAKGTAHSTGGIKR